jgi:hypothetical protein
LKAWSSGHTGIKDFSEIKSHGTLELWNVGILGLRIEIYFFCNLFVFIGSYLQKTIYSLLEQKKYHAAATVVLGKLKGGSNELRSYRPGFCRQCYSSERSPFSHS